MTSSAAHARSTAPAIAHDHSEGEVHAVLTSVGIDIGSATTHLALSELHIGKRDPRLAGKPEVLERRLLGRSRVSMTPFLPDGRLDAEEVERFVRDELATLGCEVEDIDTGAVICTGEAARRDNAAAITGRISAISGDFVCAIAGHHLEAVLGAHGSGAVLASRRSTRPIVLLDVGGGTAKRSLISGGRILETAAVNVGTRLIATDEGGDVVRAEVAGLEIARDVGVEAGLGATMSPTAAERVARRMADCLVRFLGLQDLDDLTRSLLLTDAPGPVPDGSIIAIAGGLSEYFFGRSSHRSRDLGEALSSALRARLEALVPPARILDPGGGIRATALGAGQFSVQVSGETVFLEGGLRPPLRALPVRTLRTQGTDPRTVDLERTLFDALDTGNPGPVALVLRAGRAHGYARIRDLAGILAAALVAGPPPSGLVFVLQRDQAQTFGAALLGAGLEVPFLCVDELDVNDLDFLDIGAPVRDGAFLPVVVKSVVFEHPLGPRAPMGSPPSSDEAPCPPRAEKVM